MADQKRGIIETLHGIVIIAWVLISVAVYGTLCILTRPFNTYVSRLMGVWWARNLLGIAGVKVAVRGMEKLDADKRYIFIANHQSNIDIPILIGTMRHQLSFIAKKELFAIPLFGWGMYAQGHIWIDRANARKAHASIRQAIRRLKKDNISLVLFPEGTRSIDGRIGQFKQGSFLLALQAGVEVVPLVIHNSSQLLPKHTVFIKNGTVSLTICDPISVGESMTKANISELVRGIIEDALNAVET